MNYIMLGIVGLIVVCIITYVIKGELNISVVLPSLIGLVISFGIIIAFDYNAQTADIEIWSGRITEIKHIEEWDEWIPPRTETYTETDSKGNIVTKTRTIPGYWVHHNAENYITTTDSGRKSVHQSIDGQRFTDNFVNSTEELSEFYKVGMSTASIHTFENKLKASYSIFKHKEIDLNDYELPEYPSKVNERLTVNRLIGNFKNKEKLSKKLDDINSNLNDTNNPNNKDKVKSYKQANLIFVNFGDKSEDYGYALQDYWTNGAKNDFVITFGTDKNNKPTWCYAFSWTDVEILKTDIREYIMNKENLNDFETVMNDISNMVENKFDRKEFKDFDYIQVETRTSAKIFMTISFIIFAGLIIFIEEY